ncbi:MAG: PAS domain-containing protein [Chloroflexaceae bacterium]|nr:PAS domain-containing protein [Chloroflexaceae bacterium]
MKPGELVPDATPADSTTTPTDLPHLSIPSSVAPQQILELLEQALRVPAEQAVLQAQRTNQPVSVVATLRKGEEEVLITATPVADKASGASMQVSFVRRAFPRPPATWVAPAPGNAELLTINSQLRDEIADLESTATNLNTLLVSAGITTLFLDTNLRVSQFRPAISELFTPLPGDYSYRLSDIVQSFHDTKLIDDIHAVLQIGKAISREIQVASDQWYLRRVLPYAASDTSVEGVIVTFVDISELKHAEQELRRSEERFRTALDNSQVTVFQQDADLRYTWVYNQYAGSPQEGVIGLRDDVLFERPEDATRLIALKSKVLQTGQRVREEVAISFNGVVAFFDVLIDPLYDEQGKIVGITSAAADITNLKRIEEERLVLLQREQAARARAEEAVKLRDVFFGSLARIKNTTCHSAWQCATAATAHYPLTIARAARAFPARNYYHAGIAPQSAYQPVARCLPD